MAVGIALPKAYLRKEIVSLFYLLIPGMIWMWIISGLCVWAMIPGLNFVRGLQIYILISLNFNQHLCIARIINDSILLYPYRSGNISENRTAHR